MHAPLSAAAFFRVEHVLVRRSALACATWMAARQQDPWSRLSRIGVALASVPIGAVTDPLMSTKLAWQALAGCSEDRLHYLGEAWWRQRVVNALNPEGVALVRRAQDQGERVVLVSDQPWLAIGRLLDELGADELHCNRLEIVDGRATGKLVEPVLSGRLDGAWIRQYAGRHDLSVARCSAYGGTAADATLLSAVGRPCAVTPDASLRRLAATFDWPIVEARPESA